MHCASIGCRWVKSFHTQLSKHPEFVDTGERVKASSGRMQTVWCYIPPQQEQQPAAQQRSKKALPGIPFLGKHS